jgi:hypothetical protein
LYATRLHGFLLTAAFRNDRQRENKMKRSLDAGRAQQSKASLSNAFFQSHFFTTFYYPIFVVFFQGEKRSILKKNAIKK